MITLRDNRREQESVRVEDPEEQTDVDDSETEATAECDALEDPGNVHSEQVCFSLNKTHKCMCS